MLTYENSPENFAVAILKALVHPGSKSCKCVFCERQPFRKDEMRAAVSPKTQRYLWTWVAVLYVYWKENIYLSMSRMCTNLWRKFNFKQIVKYQCGMYSWNTPLFFFLISCLHFNHYKENVVYLKYLAYFKVGIFWRHSFFCGKNI